jgi:hypothetical protein
MYCRGYYSGKQHDLNLQKEIFVQGALNLMKFNSMKFLDEFDIRVTLF